MTVVLANGLDFDVVEAGSGDPAIVFVHGLACDASAWAPQQADLSRDHRTIAINLRGRGDTPTVPPFGLEQQVLDIAAILDALGANDVMYMGHSLGGLAGLLLNETRPGLVRGIVVGDSPLREAGLNPARLNAAISESGTTEPLRAAVESFFSDETQEPVRAHVREMMLSCAPEVVVGMLGEGLSGDRMAELVRLADQKPFMAIWAERPAGEPSWLRDLTMFLRQEPVAGAGHFFQLERPEVTSALLRAFLEEASRDPRRG